MFRPRHLTGPIRRFLAAGLLAALAIAAVVTVVSAAGLGMPFPGVVLPIPTPTLPVPTPTLPVPTPTLPVPTPTLPVPTPTLPVPTPTLRIPHPSPTVPVPTPTLSVSSPTLPIPHPSPPLPSLPGGPTPSLCAANCSPSPTGGGDAGAGPDGPSGASTGTGGGGASATRPGSPAASATSDAVAASATVGPPLGLAFAAPVLVEQLTPLAGISFGKAPYLWPLFLLLDALAGAAVVLAVRRSRARHPGPD